MSAPGNAISHAFLKLYATCEEYTQLYTHIDICTCIRMLICKLIHHAVINEGCMYAIVSDTSIPGFNDGSCLEAMYAYTTEGIKE